MKSSFISFILSLLFITNFYAQEPNYYVNYDSLAKDTYERGNFKQAEEFFLLSLELKNKLYGVSSEEYFNTIIELGEIYLKSKQTVRKNNLFIKYLDSLETIMKNFFKEGQFVNALTICNKSKVIVEQFIPEISYASDEAHIFRLIASA